MFRTRSIVAISSVVLVALVAWPLVIWQLISTVLGITALCSKQGDEVRVAGSIPAACVLPAVCALWAPAPALVFILALGVSGLLWYGDARRRARHGGVDPRDTSDLELPRAIARAA